MPYPKLAISTVFFFAASLLPLTAQQATPAAAAPAPASGAPSSAERQTSANTQLAAVDEAFLHKQFGEEFSLVSSSTPYVRDIDGDGIDDLVILARSYKVVDPYYSFYGYGDPKLTATFGSEDLMEKNLVVLVIHGSGEQAWRADTPKAKFVIINLPLKRIFVKRLQLRKRQVNAIFAVEADASAGDSVVYWDGKQYKYQPIGTGGAD